MLPFLTGTFTSLEWHVLLDQFELIGCLPFDLSSWTQGRGKDTFTRFHRRPLLPLAPWLAGTTLERSHLENFALGRSVAFNIGCSPVKYIFRKNLDQSDPRSSALAKAGMAAFTASSRLRPRFSECPFVSCRCSRCIPLSVSRRD